MKIARFDFWFEKDGVIVTADYIILLMETM